MDRHRPRLLLAILAIAVLALATACTAGGARFRKGPWLVYPGDPGRMEILWQADRRPRTARVEWGETASLDHRSDPLAGEGEGPDGHLFRYAVTGLVPGRWYRYRVILDGEVREGSFRAAPPASAERVTFYGLGDTRSRPDVMNDVVSTLLDDVAADPVERQSFCLHAGDWVTGPEEAAWDAEFFDRREPAILEFESRLPILGCRGNHEGDGRLLRKYWPWPFPDPEGCWYSFDWGPVHVTVLDDQAEFGPGSPQYAWLAADLAATRRPWKVVLHHVPVFSAGGHHDNAALREVLVPLLRRHGVALVIAGHNHYYARCEVDGIRYLTLGGGGAPLATPDPAAPHVVVARRSYHFARFDVGPGEIAVTVVAPGGEVLDRFTVPRPVAVEVAP